MEKITKTPITSTGKSKSKNHACLSMWDNSKTFIRNKLKMCPDPKFFNKKPLKFFKDQWPPILQISFNYKVKSKKSGQRPIFFSNNSKFCDFSKKSRVQNNLLPQIVNS